MAEATIDYSGTSGTTFGEIRQLTYTVDDLRATHPTYEKYKDEWAFLQAAYDGAQAMVAFGAMLRHERESNDNYERRISEAYGFSYSTSVVDLFNFYLFKESVKRQLDKLADDELWLKFDDNCDLHKNSFDDFLLEVGRCASIQGVCGVLVDKPRARLRTRADEKAVSVYPYLSLYKALAILDWKVERDEYNRPTLIFLKVKDDEDDLYRIWYPDRWEVWEEPDSDEQGKAISGQTPAKRLDEGPNPLGEIPFTWVYNIKSDIRGFGRSDITDVARIDASIMRNLSQGEEVINYAAFPMMRKPWRVKGVGEPDEVGATAVLGFDPENPAAKPDWLAASVLEPIQAIFDTVISKKIEEIYRAANIGGMAGTEIQTSPKSGTALRSEFQLLNGKLVSKGKTLEKAEKEIVRFWLMWQKQMDWYETINIERADTYEVDNLAQDLENIMTSTIIVQNKEFSRRIQKKVVRLMFAGDSDDVIQELEDAIDTDIDSQPEIGEQPEFEGYIPPGQGEEIPGGPIERQLPEQQQGGGKVVPMKREE